MTYRSSPAPSATLCSLMPCWSARTRDWRAGQGRAGQGGAGRGGAGRGREEGCTIMTRHKSTLPWSTEYVPDASVPLPPVGNAGGNGVGYGGGGGGGGGDGMGVGLAAGDVTFHGITFQRCYLPAALPSSSVTFQQCYLPAALPSSGVTFELCYLPQTGVAQPHGVGERSVQAVVQEDDLWLAWRKSGAKIIRIQNDMSKERHRLQRPQPGGLQRSRKGSGALTASAVLWSGALRLYCTSMQSEAVRKRCPLAPSSPLPSPPPFPVLLHSISLVRPV